MQYCDALIVGGGPAGSTCAGELRRGGLDVIVVDKATFPRDKLCAGWVTPAVFDALGIDPAQYGRGRVLQAMTAFRVGRIGGPSRVVSYGRTVSFGIQRRQFDDYLLRRADVRLQLGQAVRSLVRLRARLGGQRGIPSAAASGGGRTFLSRRPAACSAAAGRDGRDPVVVGEEFEIELSPSQQARCAVDPLVPEIYFCDDLLGYGWCLRKGPLLNVGLGREDRRGWRGHVEQFFDFLRREGRIAGELSGKFHGHAYQLYDHSTRPLAADGVLWIGDAAGMARPQSGEGIGPAIESGRLAAEVILAAQGDYAYARWRPTRGESRPAMVGGGVGRRLR